MSLPDGVSIREMTVADIPAGLRLCRASRWNQTERDWQHFLVSAPRGALVAVDSGSVIGTVATLPYGAFAWISMVLVDPAVRHRGIGTLLLNRGLALLPEDVTARLDATPAGEVIYRKLGFVAEYGLARLFRDARSGVKDRPEGRPLRRPATRIEARPLARGDWPAIHQMDARVFGASRATLLERLAADAPEYAWVAERDGQAHGYLLGRHGHVREHLGPLIADSPEVAGVLLDACLSAHSDRDFIIDAPDDQQEWRERLAQLGFGVERPFLRMYRGPLTTPGQPAQVYAIAGPELG